MVIFMFNFREREFGLRRALWAFFRGVVFCSRWQDTYVERET